MATVVNNADRGEGRSWGPAILVLVIVLAALAFMAWGFPNSGGSTTTPTNTIDANVETTLPAGGTGGDTAQ